MVEQEQWRNKIEEIFLVDRRFRNGEADYREFALGRTPVPTLIVNGKKYLLDRHNFFNPQYYIERFREVLFFAEERSAEGNPYFVHYRDYKGRQQFLPIQPEDVKIQLFGFGWAALDIGDIETALPALRASGTLGEDRIIRQLKGLAAREEVKFYLQLRILQEEAFAKKAIHRLEKRVGRERTRAERALERARQTLEILKKILSVSVVTPREK